MGMGITTIIVMAMAGEVRRRRRARRGNSIAAAGEARGIPRSASPDVQAVRSRTVQSGGRVQVERRTFVTREHMILTLDGLSIIDVDDVSADVG